MDKLTFYNIPEEERLAICQNVESKTGIPDFAVEKDWWVVQTLKATYVWHLSKETAPFKKELELINQKLNWIRNNGRQSFLETKGKNFSKIIHDYGEDKKGFYKWKNALEERLV